LPENSSKIRDLIVKISIFAIRNSKEQVKKIIGGLGWETLIKLCGEKEMLAKNMADVAENYEK